MHLEELKVEVLQAAHSLRKFGLVWMAGGTICARDPESGHVVVTPSGLDYSDLTPEDMIVVDMDGKVVEGDYKPSSDVFSHLNIYKYRPDVGGVVHTHSRYASAFAAVGKPIPCVLTAIADEFGGPIPCGGFALIGDHSIGQIVVESIGSSPAVLLKNHGVFTVGKDARAAVKAAVMAEDAAATVWMAMQIGRPDSIPSEDIQKLHARYMEVYGQ